MRMEIHEARRDDAPGGVDDVITRQLCANLDDHAVLDCHFRQLLAAGVDDASTLQHGTSSRANVSRTIHDATWERCDAEDSPANKSNNTAMRTDTPLETC